MFCTLLNEAKITKNKVGFGSTSHCIVFDFFLYLKYVFYLFFNLGFILRGVFIWGVM